MYLEIYKDCIFAFIIIAGLIGVYHTRHQSNSFWSLFPYFLIILGCLDGIGIFLAKNGQMELSQQLYVYLIIPGQIIFYIWLYYKDQSGSSIVLYIGLLIYLSSMVIESVFKVNGSEFSFTSLAYLVGNLILLVNILNFFFQLTRSNRILYFFKEKMFWVSLGLLIFWLGSLPYYGLFNFLYRKHYAILETYCWFVMTFNYLMYSFFIIAFVWAKKS